MTIPELVLLATLAFASSVGVFLLSMTILSRWVCNLHDSIPKWTMEYALHLVAFVLPVALLTVWLLKGKGALVWDSWHPILTILWALFLCVSVATFAVFTMIDVWKLFRGPVAIKGVRVRVEPVPFKTNRCDTKIFLPRWNQVHCLNRVEVQIGLAELDEGWDGLKIGHLSDFHFGRVCNRDYVRHAVDRVMEKTPDLVAITGDFMNFDKYIDDCFATLNGLAAPLGVYVVRGNHDYWCDLARIEREVSDLGFVLLHNRTVEIEREGARMWISGTERPWDHSNDRYDFIPEGSNRLKIVLCHIPDEFPSIAKRNPDLVLSGHTHGGQICFPFFGPALVPSRYGRKYAAGVFGRGKSLLYVSRGIGCHPPLRTLCNPEVTLLTLSRQEKVF